MACLLLAGNTESLVAQSPPDAAEVAKLIRGLDDADFQVRTRATRALGRYGAEVLEPLSVVLKDGSLEQRVRAIEIVGRIYSRGEAASFYSAEQILDRVARDANGSLMVSAQSTLETNYLVRQRLAVAEIEKMGGRVLLVQAASAIPPDEDLPADASEEKPPEDDSLIVGIMIDRTWKGGDEGLKQVRRLSRLMYLYRDKLAPLSPEALNDLQADMPRMVQQIRGPAYLGIKPLDLRINGATGCGIGEVTAGSAAAKAGMMPHDLITSFDSQPVKDFNSLIELIADKLPGDKVKISVLRNNGESVELEAELSAWPKLNFPP